MGSDNSGALGKTESRGIKVIHLFFGDYQLKENDLVIDKISNDTIRKNVFTKDKNIVCYTDEVGIGKKEIDELIDSKKPIDMTIVCHDIKLIKGKRKETKKYTLTVQEGPNKAINPFELGKLVFSCKDRDLLFNYLKDSKNSLFILMMSLACNTHKLTPANRKTVEWLCKNYYLSLIHI